LERFSDDVAKGKSPRLMLLMPPRHGKSEIASKNFPAWHLGRFPDHEFIACSYNLSLAMGFSRKVKQIIEDPSYETVFPDTKIDPNNGSTEEWGVHNRRGGYVAAGIGGPITGKGAHVLVIDDPVKNAEEADSADAREKIWEWYLSTAYSRLAPGGGVLVIQTWWHDDDLAGKLQQMMASGSDDEHVDQFEVIKYPAIAEADEWLEIGSEVIYRVEHQDKPALERRDLNTPEALGDPLRDSMAQAIEAQNAQKRLAAEGKDPADYIYLRAKGEALHPARYDLKKLLRIKAQNKGGRWWSALYQQNPVPDDGAYFTREQFRRQPVPRVRDANVFIAFDFAISEKKQNDYTVGSVGLQDADDMLHVAEVLRFKSGDAFFIVEAILNLAARWYSPSLILGFEDGQIYRAIEALLRKRMRERKLYLAIEVLKPITDKMARARVLQGRMQQGMVSFDEKAEWFDAVRTEMLRFPAGIHDDCVDSLAWMAQLVVGRQAPRRPQEQKVKSWKDRVSTTGLGNVGYMAA
jgi:predicted phage terminase large subunit-like protein